MVDSHCAELLKNTPLPDSPYTDRPRPRSLWRSASVSISLIVAFAERSLQAAGNTEQQFNGSPDHDREIENSIVDAMEAYEALSTRALNSKAELAAIKHFLLDVVGLYRMLRRQLSSQ